MHKKNLWNGCNTKKLNEYLLRVPLSEIGERFEKLYGIKIIYDFGGSGRLGNKILVGQSPDVFIPGSNKWAKILKKKGYIEGYSPIAYHTPVIITPKENSKVNSLDDFSDIGNRLVLGDARAAAIGGASAAIFKKAGIAESRMNVRALNRAILACMLFSTEGRKAPV